MLRGGKLPTKCRMPQRSDIRLCENSPAQIAPGAAAVACGGLLVQGEKGDRRQTAQAPASIAQIEFHSASLMVFETRARSTREDMGGLARRVDAAFTAKDRIDLLLIMTNHHDA
jgi:hypothetical protein